MFVNYKNTLTMKVNKLIGKGMIALAACFMAMPVQAQQDKRLKDTYPRLSERSGWRIVDN